MLIDEFAGEQWKRKNVAHNLQLLHHKNLISIKFSTAHFILSNYRTIYFEYDIIFYFLFLVFYLFIYLFFANSLYSKKKGNGKN